MLIPRRYWPPPTHLARLFGIQEDFMAALGTGSRFRQLSVKLAARGARDPDALAAWIGRRKHGKARFQKLSAAGRDKS
ncbi:hypothetical protein [Streptomyces sp. WAC 06738]|uniref:hypothetical protein n=1 Tax=Streptomyces sp. WAC 06738 TaxID=2203210 RepID=UPI000F785FBA|nr:hypothetical protein [Streptomyces sp. WAC 06738]